MKETKTTGRLLFELFIGMLFAIVIGRLLNQSWQLIIIGIAGTVLMIVTILTIGSIGLW